MVSDKNSTEQTHFHIQHGPVCIPVISACDISIWILVTRHLAVSLWGILYPCVSVCVLWSVAYTKLMMSSSLETLYKAKPPGRWRCSGLWCLVCVDPATCLILWITSSSVGVVTGLRASSRCWLRMCGRGLFFRLTVEFFTTFAFGDSRWDSSNISSSLDNASSVREEDNCLSLSDDQICWKRPATHFSNVILDPQSWLNAGTG